MTTPLPAERTLPITAACSVPPVGVKLSDAEIKRIAETLPDLAWRERHPEDTQTLLGWGQGYRLDGDGRYTIPNVVAACLPFARAIEAALARPVGEKT